MGAYLRKMAIDGYIVNTDTTPLKKQYEEIHKIGVNINQLAKHINTLPSDENILYSLDRINQYLSDVETINRKLL